MILGILTASMLAERRYPEGVWDCDGIELRADGLPATAVVSAGQDFNTEKKRHSFNGPVFFTLRLQRDGGAWENARATEREPLWTALAESSNLLCDYLDIEIQEVGLLDWNTLKKFRAAGLKLLLSHHSFVAETTGDWEKLLALMRGYHPDAVKFAVTTEDSQKAGDLLRFAKQVAREFHVSCVIAMGEAGRATRVASPFLGCPITYAFLESSAVAPGQLSVKVLRYCFAQTQGKPAQDSSEKEWIAWVEQTLRDANHVA